MTRLLSFVGALVLAVAGSVAASPAGPASASDATGDCEVAYILMAQWPGGFQSQVTLRNLSETTTSGWEATLDFPDGQWVRPPWDPIGIPPLPGDPIRIRNTAWNGAIPPGASITFSLLGTYSGSNGAPSITCTLLF